MTGSRAWSGAVYRENSPVKSVDTSNWDPSKQLRWRQNTMIVHLKVNERETVQQALSELASYRRQMHTRARVTTLLPALSLHQSMPSLNLERLAQAFPTG